MLVLIAFPACSEIWGFADLRNTGGSDGSATDGIVWESLDPGVGGASISGGAGGADGAGGGGAGGFISTDSPDAGIDSAAFDADRIVDRSADVGDVPRADSAIGPDLGGSDHGFEVGPDLIVVDAPATEDKIDASVDLAFDPCADKQCPGACASASRIIRLDGPENNSGNFLTLGSVCIVHAGAVARGWALANYDGRLVTVFGAVTVGPFDPSVEVSTQPPIGPAPDGYVYWVLLPGPSPYVQLFYF